MQMRFHIWAILSRGVRSIFQGVGRQYTAIPRIQDIRATLVSRCSWLRALTYLADQQRFHGYFPSIRRGGRRPIQRM